MSVNSEAKDLIASAVVAGVKKAAASDDTAATFHSIATDVLNEVAPVIVHATNNEPWYQSRVTWGVIIAAIGTMAKPLIGELPIDASQTTDIVNALATAGQAVGFALTLYGRWKAKKPIGS